MPIRKQHNLTITLKPIAHITSKEVKALAQIVRQLIWVQAYHSRLQLKVSRVEINQQDHTHRSHASHHQVSHNRSDLTI